MTDVFISHAKADRKHIRRIAKALEADGLKVWWEQNTSNDGKWTPALQRALVESAAIIAVWTEESVTSQWVKAEASHGRDRQALIAVSFGECKIPAEFKDIPSPDFTKWRGDVEDPDWVRIITRVRALIKAKGELGSQPASAPPPFTPAAAPRPVQQQPQQAEPAAQIVAPSAFFSANLGGANARAASAPGRAAPMPPQPAPRPAPAPRPPPAPRAFQPIDEPSPPPTPPAPPPRVLRPVEPPPAPPPRPMRPAPPPVPPARLFEPVDEAPAAKRTPDRPRPAPRPARVDAYEEPPRARPPADAPAPTRRRRGPGAAQIFMMLVLVAGAAGGVIWGAQRFLSAPSAPSLAEDTGAPEPLPIEPPVPETQYAEAAPIEEPEVEDTSAPLTAPPPAVAAPRQTPAPQPRTTAAEPPTAPAARPPQQLVLQGASAPEAAGRSEADVMQELERCLGRLVRQCPGANGASRPGFSEDGVLSTAERALLRQRSLFAFSEVMDTNLVNCQRHLGAAAQGSHEPLATACRALPASGPPR